MSRFRYYKPVVTQDGKVVVSASVAVVEGTGTTAATIYESETGSAITGGIATSNATTGMVDFWVDEADYNGGQLFSNIITKDSYSSQTLPWSGASIGLRRGRIQSVTSATGAVSTGTTRIVADDSIPQITEGDQYLSLAITPVNTASVLTVDVQVSVANSVPNVITAALFQDSTAAALTAMSDYKGTANTLSNIAFKYVMTAGTVSETTFTVRCGGNAAGTTTFNGVSAGRIMGGVMASRITITESTAT